MQVYVCGVADELQPFSLTIPGEAKSSWNRCRIFVYEQMRKVVTQDVLSRYFSPLYLTSSSEIIQGHEDLKTATEVVVIPRGSYFEEAQVDVVAATKNHHIWFSWEERMDSFRKFDEYTSEMQRQLSNLNFCQVESHIVKCQNCQCVQRLDNFFLPVMLQHAITNPSCTALEMWNGKMITSASMISNWLQQLVTTTIKTINSSKFAKSFRNALRRPNLADHDPERVYKCSICLVNSAEVIYLLCLHFVTCIACYQAKQDERCQNCQQNITCSSNVYN